MLKPIQRIPQYRLLLEQYLKCLPHTHPDYMDTQMALRVVANVATHANNTMNQGLVSKNNFMKLLALHDRLNSSHSTSTGDHGNSNSRRPRYELVRPGRYLLKEGELLKLCRREMQPRYFILLSDVLLYTSFVTSGPGGALRLNCELTLEGMKVETPKAEDFKNEFSVISTSRSFTLQASTAEERDAWIKALREAIEDNASRRSTFLQAKMPIYQQPSTSTLGKQAPVWIPDYRVTMCQQCTAEFTLTFRRHHCRACGKVVCDHCSANRAPLQYKKNQVARVCDNCFEILQKDFENRYEGSVIQEDQQGSRMRRVPSLKAQFKKGIRDSNRYRTRKRAPERLMELQFPLFKCSSSNLNISIDSSVNFILHGLSRLRSYPSWVCASDTSSQMCGYLRMLVRRSWRKGWFVLKDRVLYEYRAPQDVCALQSLPVLGYHVQTMQEVRELADGVDVCLAFQLTHPNQEPFVFHADSPHLAEKWIQAMKEAVILT
ncbi:FYVE, RhoGEF and PH domain-containing protein 6-like [Panulirus ornatus]|uniref:FYVE, RhoGEF and PH domain-containing protein 6-like n=1 Tax=Panulirus ornatus TaxID=150431 RepID=UPI003A85AF36